MNPVALLTSIMSVSLGLTLYGDRSQNIYIQAIFKTLTSLCFIGLGMVNGSTNVLMTALWLCLAGDVLLLGSSSGMFLSGLVSFLLGHVWYIIAFYPRWELSRETTWRVGCCFMGMLPAVILISTWILQHTPKPMKAPVAAYIVVITVMVLSSVAANDTWSIAAAVLFFLSDITVARNKFVHKGFVNRIVGLPLYYAGQWMFALSGL
eukprot:PhF_6_TR5771/c0_g1_i2/m.8513